MTGIRSKHHNLNPGDTLFRTGDEARFLVYLKRGSLRLSRDGVTLHRAEAGELLAEHSLFISHHDCDAVAVTTASVESFPKAAVLLHLSAHPGISLALSAHLADQIRDLRFRLELSRLKTAAERVVAYLTHQGAAAEVIHLTPPLVVIATELGLTHEALYRALAKLVRENRLERPGRGLFRLL